MAELNVHKVTLGSKKVIYLREPKIKDQELATQLAGKYVKDDNRIGLAMAIQKEMLKMLLVKIDDNELSGPDKEDLDKLLSYQDYMQLQMVMGKITGGSEEELGNFEMEMITSGGI